MSAWATLLPVALVGTERHAGAMPAWPGEIGATIALAVAEPTPRAAAVLRTAATLAACEAAGVLGAPWSQALPEPALAESRAVLPDGALRTLADWALRDGPPRLLHELSLALERAGIVLPPALLPLALDAGRRSIGLRSAITPALGARGLWLAAQHDDWRWAAGVVASDDDALWAEGSLEQRRDVLRRGRTHDAARARERLAEVLPELPAKERAEFVGLLGVGLSVSDEALLDGLRSDRSKDVRQAALDLLLRLPEAAHPRRAAVRLARLVTQERGLLRKRWAIDAPMAAEADWKDDNVEAIRPKDHPLGERAWWLHQLVGQVPLAWWCAHTGMPPAELRDWAAGSEWADAIVRGWRNVLHAAPDAAWCEAFLDQWPKDWMRDERGVVLAFLPAATRERYWERELQVDTTLEALAPQWLAACAPGQTLSRPFSATVARVLRQRIDAGDLVRDWMLRSHATDIACVLHADALPAMRNLPRAADETPALADTMHTLAQTIDTRLALRALSSSAEKTP